MKVINTHVLYQDLLLDLGLSYDEPLKLDPWDTPSTVARKALASSFLKKFQDEINQEYADSAALDKFLSVNSRCGTWQLECESFLDVVLVQYLKGYLDRFFIRRDGTPILEHPYEILDLARCGPGASVGSESTDFYTKLFDSKLASTRSGLYRMYADYIRSRPLWREAEEIRLSSLGQSEIVAGSRFSFVPKTTLVSRTICIEPTLNMFFQLGAGGLIEKRLRNFFNLDLTTQPDVNRSLAYLGSLNDSLVTIDLASASDSLSLRMLEMFLPRQIMSWLHLMRSPVTDIPGYGKLELNMVSTMGNGFTFPLQTALFSCVVAACFDAGRDQRVDNPYDPDNLFSKRTPNWAVFGDDIIVPKSIAPRVLRLLELLGFEVNRDKTFLEGPFRESCGEDYFLGKNVRGVYIKTLRTPQARYSAINLLNAWSWRWQIPLPRTMRCLSSGLRTVAVPPWENADCGIWVPEKGLRLLGIKRRTDRNGTRIYYASRPRQKAFRVQDDAIHVPRGQKPRGFNPPGLLTAFLAGTIENGKILIRPNQVRYSTKLERAPSWDHAPTTLSPFKGSGGGSASEEAVFINLMNAWR